ncbi:MAG: proton-conducting transporter membrane subunit [Parcubacteria group bacterium]|jgi:hydrogenase-4 component F
MALFLIIFIPFIASGLSFLVRKKIQPLNTIAILASSIELISALIVVSVVAQKGSYAWTPYLSIDPLGAILLLLVAIIGFVASWYSTGYLQVEVKKGIIGFHRVREYFILLHLFLLAMFFAISTTNPILMWVMIEATTLSTAFLISFYNKPSAMEAAWKYLIVNSVGLLLAFFGTLIFLYPSFAAGNHGLVNWHALLVNASGLDPFVAKIAFIFILIGYGTKVGFVPMHTWLPDAHSKAPVPISSLLSGVLLNVAFLAILRFKVIVDLAVGANFSSQMLIFFGIISIIVAAAIIFIQKNYKRLLAYSSIEHMGVMALGFGFGGVGIFAAILHMIYHSLAKSILFLSAGNIFLKYSSTKIAKVKGVLKVLPVTSILFLIGFLAITGMPPFGIFVTEFSILSAGISSHPAVTIIALLALALIFVGFLRHVVAMIFGENEENVPVGESGVWTIFPVLILVVLLVYLSIFIPATINSLITSASLVY